VVSWNGSTLATIDVPATGGWGVWQTVSVADVSIPGGEGILRLDVVGGHYNLDYVEFTQVDTTTPTATPTPTAPPTTDDDYGEQAYGELGYGGTA
jgi:hypothetical protein